MNQCLWCHGVSTHTAKRRKDVSSESKSDSDNPKYKKKCKKRKRKLTTFANRVEELVSKLKEKHGSRYSTIQYPIWAEVADVGSHE